MTVTRLWYQHRSIAELSALAGIAISFTALLATLFVSGKPGVETLITVAGVPLAILAGLRVQALDTLRNQGINPPRLWLGDLLRNPDGEEDAFLLHVTVSGIVIREQDPATGTWRPATDVSFAEIASRRYHAEEFTQCGECSLINPHCEWHLTKRTGGTPRRLIF